MAIVKMNQFTLFTFDFHKDALLKELQRFEEIQFKDLKKDDLPEFDFLNKDISAEEINQTESELAKVRFAISKIEPYVVKNTGLKALRTPAESLDYHEFDSYPDRYDYETIFQSVKTEDETINRLKSEITKLKSENEELRAWKSLDASLADFDKMKFVKYCIGTINKTMAEDFRVQAEDKYKTAYIEFLGNIKDDAAFLVALPSQEYEEAFAFFKTLGFSRMTVGFQGVPEDEMRRNLERIKEREAEKEKALHRIKAMNREYQSLQIISDYYETRLERAKAVGYFLKTQSVFMMEGWVPEGESGKFHEIITRICGNDCYLEEEAVDKESSDVPIKLKNNGFAAAFEDVTVMFSLPRYNEIDPTPVLAPFYMVFFGLMVGDTGYGLLLLIGTALALRFFDLKEGMKRFVKFFFYLSFAVILAGFVYGSFFGLAFFTPISAVDENGVQIHKAILDTNLDVLQMMVISVGIGVIQVLFGIFVKGYMLLKEGKIFAAVFDSLFFAIVLLGGLGWLLGAAMDIPAMVGTVSMWACILGIIGLALTQGRESPSIGGKIGSGLYEVYGLTGYVGDLVSYTRLAALALSGAYIAFSFNLMAGLIPAGPAGIVRFIFGGIIVIFGQAINLGLGLLGAYVHTCRLQYVEFFGKFYEGGGIPFEAFKIKNKFIKIRK